MLISGLAIAIAFVAGWAISRARARTQTRAILAQVDPHSEIPVAASGGPLGQLQDHLVAARVAQAKLDNELASERAARRELERALGASEARYALALRSASDGIWEMDVATRSLELSPTVRSMLGLDAVTDQVNWIDILHTNDAAALLSEIDLHLDEQSNMVDISCRARMENGGQRWLHVRGRALRHANDRPYKLIGVVRDITDRKRAEDVLHGIAVGMATASGDDFFRLIVRNFAEVMGANLAFVARCKDKPPTEVQILAAWKGGDFIEPFDFALVGTPCQATIRDKRITTVCENLEGLYPIEVGFESYLGVPIFDPDGEVLGHLACFGRQSMTEEPHLEPIFSIFATRAGLEIERRQMLMLLEQPPQGAAH